MGIEILPLDINGSQAFVKDVGQEALESMDERGIKHTAYINKIRAAFDLEEVIDQYVFLRKAGRNYVGICPFHGGKDPYFSVDPDNRSFHCFGCKKGGDIFLFWMEYHGVSFQQAIDDLAERYEIPQPKK